MPLLIPSSLTEVLPFCLRSCRLGVSRELSSPAGHHGNHDEGLPPGSLMSRCTLKLISCGPSRKEALPHSGRWKKGREAGVMDAAQAGLY